MARIVGQERIADVFGVAPKTIVEWQEAGFPIAKRGSPGISSEYETADCIAWYLQREKERAGVESAKDRLARLQGDKVERELRILDRELIRAEEIEPAISQFLLDLSNQVDQIADEYTDAIVAVAGDAHAIHQTLRNIAAEVKRTCASYEFSQGAGEASAEEDLQESS